MGDMNFFSTITTMFKQQNTDTATSITNESNTSQTLIESDTSECKTSLDTSSSQFNTAYHKHNHKISRIFKYMLEIPELLAVSEIATLEKIAKSLNLVLSDSFSYAWYCQSPLQRNIVYNQGKRSQRVPLLSRMTATRKVQQMKLGYIDEVAIPNAHLEYVHMYNKRTKSTCAAIEYLQQHPHFLDNLRNTNPNKTIIGVLCDLAILPNARLARLLSLKRISALTSVITRDITSILDIKKRIADLRTARPNIGHTTATAFLSADHSTTDINLDSQHRPNLNNEPGFIGYADDLFIFRPEHEHLRHSVFHNLFGCFVVFKDSKTCQDAWKKRRKEFGETKISFLSLDTYDCIVLAEGAASMHVYNAEKAVWSWDATDFKKMEHQMDCTASMFWSDSTSTNGSSDEKQKDGHNNVNPFSTPATSNMKTADEKQAFRKNLTTQPVCVFAHGTFRNSTMATRRSSFLRYHELLKVKRRLKNEMYGMFLGEYSKSGDPAPKSNIQFTKRIV